MQHAISTGVYTRGVVVANLTGSVWSNRRLLSLCSMPVLAESQIWPSLVSNRSEPAKLMQNINGILRLMMQKMMRSWWWCRNDVTGDGGSPKYFAMWTWVCHEKNGQNPRKISEERPINKPGLLTITIELAQNKTKCWLFYCSVWWCHLAKRRGEEYFITSPYNKQTTK